jgi:lysophospholipase L1-like esterase
MSGAASGEQEVVVTVDGLPRPATVLGRHSDVTGDRVLVRFRQAGGFEERWVPAADVLPVEEGPARPPLGKIIGLVLVGLLGLALLLYPSGSDRPLLTDEPTPSPTATASASPTPTLTATPSPSATPVGVSAVLFGDAFTAGRGVTPSTPTALEVAAKRLGWRAVTKARAKTGFTTHPSYAERLALEVRSAPDVLLVQGGASDTGASAAELTRAVRATLAAVQQRFPGTRVVLMGPVAMEQPVDQSLVRVNTVLRAVAKERRVTYIDPIGLRWITKANYRQYLSATGFYPDADGHAYLGAKIAQVLRAG